MAHSDDHDQPMNTGTHNQQQPTDGNQQSAGEDTSAHGSTGEGAGSALARLISQEQARLVPGAAENSTDGSS